MESWLFARVRQRSDVLLAVGLVVGIAVTWAVQGSHAPAGPETFVLNVVGAFVLIWRRRAPVLIPLAAYVAVAASFFLSQYSVPVFSQVILYLAGYTTISAAASVRSLVIRVGACVVAMTVIVAVVVSNILLAFVESVAIVGFLTWVTLLARNASAEKSRLVGDVEGVSRQLCKDLRPQDHLA